MSGARPMAERRPYRVGRLLRRGSGGRTPRIVLIFATTLMTLGLLPSASAQGDGHGYGGRVVSHEGWYTEEQADRGEEEYARHCARCHLVGLDGVIGFSPSLVGPEFLARWEGSSLHRLFHWVRTMMPLDDPASLHDETYLDILAHVLRANGLPAGEVELRPSAGQLSRMALPEAEEEEVEASPERGDPQQAEEEE